jgi:hypothetical protein
MRLLSSLVLVSSALVSAEPDVIRSRRAATDFALTADPLAPHWKAVEGVIAENDAMGRPTPGHRTEIRSQWTVRNLYFLFICPYEELHLKPQPDTTRETGQLWDWDVAEIFAGADFSDIHRYREFQVSPQGEYIDLDIDTRKMNWRGAMEWNSGFEVKAVLDRERKVWFAEMRIPIASIDSRPAGVGNEIRINFYRLQGPPPHRKQVTWRPTHSESHHVPESFGRLVFAE